MLTNKKIAWVKCFVITGLIGVSLSLFMTGPAFADQPPSPEEIAQTCGGPATGVSVLTDRMPKISADKLTEPEKEALAEFTKTWEERTGRKGGEAASGAFGPYVPLLRSPQVLLDTVQLGTQLQFKSVLPPLVRQFVMAITARQWSQEYMWSVHCPQALKAGASPDVIEALKVGRYPKGMTEDEATAYDFLDELRRNQSVSDTTYNQAVSKFGEQGVIEMIALNGYYTYLSMVLNATRHPLNKGVTPGLPLFPH